MPCSIKEKGMESKQVNDWLFKLEIWQKNNITEIAKINFILAKMIWIEY